MPRAVLAAFAALVASTACAPGAIPPDPPGSAPETSLNNLQPAASFALEAPGSNRVRVTLLGLIDPVTLQPIEFRANETVWLAEDGKLKGLRVTQSQRTNALPFDIVFTVDNSGSMGQEADEIADGIVAFSKLVEDSGGLLRFAVVGYSGRVSGAIDFSTATEVESYLKRMGVSGTGRTRGYLAGDAGVALSAAATAMASPSSENGIAGVVFAERNFAWRAGAQRVFINFTDEPTQPGNKPEWTTATLCGRWRPEDGTIYTVWSGTTSVELDGGTTWTPGSRENPADLSRCTPAGVIKAVKPDATDLDLTTLPLTDALRSSALLEFLTANPAVPHEVVITVKNGTTSDGKTTFPGVEYKP